MVNHMRSNAAIDVAIMDLSFGRRGNSSRLEDAKPQSTSYT